MFATFYLPQTILFTTPYMSKATIKDRPEAKHTSFSESPAVLSMYY